MQVIITFLLVEESRIFIAASTTPGPGPTRTRLWPNPEPGAKGPEGQLAPGGLTPHNQLTCSHPYLPNKKSGDPTQVLV